jgi:DNA-directed RNA polymerase specialized sigma24 family protein
MRAPTLGFNGPASGPDESRAGQWLFLVAWREAWRLHRIEAREADRTVELAAAEQLEDRRIDPEPLVALWDALARLRPRQQRLLLMQAAGLRYQEITTTTGDSFRTVDRQLVRARAALRGALAA